MTFHVAALLSNVASYGAQELAPVPDARLSINAATNRFWSSQDIRILAAFSGGVGLTHTWVATPWRPPSVLTQVSGTLTPGSPPSLATYFKYPVRVPAREDIIVGVSQESGAPQDVVALLFYTTSTLDPAPEGDSLTVIAAGFGPTIAGQWTELSVVWPVLLPAGEYAIVGGSAVGDTALAFRLVLEGAPDRPGMLAMTTRTSLPHDVAFNGGLGRWGSFVAPVMPRVEVLTYDIEPVVIIHLQLVPMSGQL